MNKQSKLDKELEIAAKRSLLKNSYYDFSNSFGAHSITKNYVDNWHIKYLCGELQSVAEHVFKREKNSTTLL